MLGRTPLSHVSRRHLKDIDESCQRRVLAQCAKKHEIGELKERVWFEPIKAKLNRMPNHSLTARHAQRKQGLGSSVEHGCRKNCTTWVGFTEKVESVVKQMMREHIDPTAGKNGRRKRIKRFMFRGCAK